MANKRHKPEEIVQKLRQVDVLVGRGVQRVDARQVQNAVLDILARKSKRSGATEKATERFMTNFFRENL